MKRLTKNLLLWAPLIVGMGTILLSLAIVYQNTIHKTLYVTEKKAYEWEREGYAISLTKPLGSEKLQMKVSIALSETIHGCEFIYGAAVVNYPEQQRDANLFSIASPRYFIKFSYDLKNKRCESKDLTVDPSDVPNSIGIQIIDTIVNPDTVEEHPRYQGILVQFAQGAEAGRVETKQTPIEAKEPFLSARTTPRQEKFSVNPRAGEVSLITSPYESLRDRLLSEFRIRIDRCRTTGDCPGIQMAVSLVTDPNILELIDEAQAVGMHVENINAPGPRNFGYKTMPWDKTIYRKNAPWYWLRGNPDFNISAHLPMHAKFVIFGDDLVISSNSNYNLDLFYKSRELGIEYRSPEIVRMFKEIFTLIRTSVFYPIKVDLNDRFLLLFNADRPRGYSASSMKPFQSITTNEDVESTAYGILFELFERNPGKLRLDMSPISNYCSYYRRVYCLYDLLDERIKRNAVEIFLNLNFYQTWTIDEPRFWHRMSTFWSRKAIDEALPTFSKSLTQFTKWNEEQPGSVELVSMMYQRMSNHHARSATLGDDFLLNGSANYAQPSTLNTIEILKDHQLRKELDEVFDTYDEPYFIVNDSPRSPPEFTFQGCEFVFERDLLRHGDYAPKQYRLEDIRERAHSRGITAPDLTFVRPQWKSSIYEEQQELHSLQYEEISLETADASIVENISSYFCVKSSSGETQVVRVPPISSQPE